MTFLDKEPEHYARLLLKELGLTRVNNLSELLIPLRLTVREVSSESFEGILVCHKNRSKGIIAINSNIREVGRKHFTICHEVGHFILPGHGESSCKANMIESWNGILSPQEIDANRVASELLLPASEVYPIVTKEKATITLAKKLSKEFGVSLTAATLKVVELTEESCALVWSEGNCIKWFKRNENFGRYINIGKLDEQTLAANLFNNSDKREIENSVYAEFWLSEDDKSSKDKIWEDSIALPYYNAVLTILTL